jgi:hypothetical protein
VTPQLPPWEWGLPEHVKAEKIQKLIKERDEKERLEKERLERGGGSVRMRIPSRVGRLAM